jgi:hypothetical protein
MSLILVMNCTWCILVLTSPNLLKRNYSSYEAENAVTSQRNHPTGINIFHNADVMIARPQQTLFRRPYNFNAPRILLSVSFGLIY